MKKSNITALNADRSFPLLNIHLNWHLISTFILLSQSYAKQNLNQNEIYSLNVCKHLRNNYIVIPIVFLFLFKFFFFTKKLTWEFELELHTLLSTHQNNVCNSNQINKLTFLTCNHASCGIQMAYLQSLKCNRRKY